jgi:hypothetical protein
MGMQTYLRLVGTLIVTVGGSSLLDGHVSPLCQTLLSLGLSDLDLLLLTTASQLIGLEGSLRLEVASVLGDVTLGHRCCIIRDEVLCWLTVGSSMFSGSGVEDGCL